MYNQNVLFLASNKPVISLQYKGQSVIKTIFENIKIRYQAGF